MNPQTFGIYDLLARNAVAQKDDLALVTEIGEERTFARLLERVDALGSGLAARGLAPGDRVAILAQNFAAYFELYLACARQGVVAYPFNWRWSREEVARLLERARPRAFVSDQSTSEKIPDAVLDDEGLAFRAVFDGTPPPGWVAFDDLYREPGATTPPASIELGAPFAVIATAAVDVVPRGAVLTHGNVLASSAMQIGAMRLGPGDRNLLALPLFHIAALGNAMGVFQAGGANVVMAKFDADAAVELIDRWHVTYMSDFPPVLATVLDAAARRGTRLPSLRIVSGLDAPAVMERLQEATSADFWTGFGQTETSGFVTVQRYRDLPGAAGKSGSLCRVRLVDDFDREVAAGTPGEIVVRGPIVFQGYDGQPDVTAYTFRDGWHHTGDVGRFDEAGRLYYVKRKAEKELIKPGGENVYPAEVETVIVELAGIRHACVFGVPDATWGEAIRAVVELDGTAAEAGALSAEAVIEHVGSRIARYKRPKHVVLVERLPRTEDGAIDREAVKAQWSQASRGSGGE
jgi:acyl-CoA synthetase (AMP-forming)/AMP-acid ligase II